MIIPARSVLRFIRLRLSAPIDQNYRKVAFIGKFELGPEAVVSENPVSRKLTQGELLDRLLFKRGRLEREGCVHPCLAIQNSWPISVAFFSSAAMMAFF